MKGNEKRTLKICKEDKDFTKIKRKEKRERQETITAARKGKGKILKGGLI